MQLIEYERRMQAAEQRIINQEIEIRNLFALLRDFTVGVAHFAAHTKKIIKPDTNQLTEQEK